MTTEGVPGSTPAEAPLTGPTDPQAEPASSAPVEAPPPKKGRAKLIVLSTSSFLLLVLVLAAIYFLIPVKAKTFEDPVDAESRSANTALYATLLAAGINDPFVDVNNERAYVVYVMPNATAPGNQSEVYQRFVLGAAADAAPHTKRLFVLQYQDATPTTLWAVDVADVVAYVQGALDAAAFEAKITKTDF